MPENAILNVEQPMNGRRRAAVTDAEGRVRAVLQCSGRAFMENGKIILQADASAEIIGEDGNE